MKFRPIKKISNITTGMYISIFGDIRVYKLHGRPSKFKNHLDSKEQHKSGLNVDWGFHLPDMWVMNGVEYRGSHFEVYFPNLSGGTALFLNDVGFGRTAHRILLPYSEKLLNYLKPLSESELFELSVTLAKRMKRPPGRIEHYQEHLAETHSNYYKFTWG